MKNKVTINYLKFNVQQNYWQKWKAINIVFWENLNIKI